MKIPERKHPAELFQEWLDEAIASEGKEDATAMSLSTIGEDGIPDSRMVLLKDFDQSGFVFYTNLNSRKGRQLKQHPFAALCFHWKGLGRQVRIRGPVEQVSEAEADAYFQSRPRESRIGAWASKQSEELEDSLALEKRVALFTAKYAIGEIPRPPHWSGFRVKPVRIEFWVNRPFRLHERLVYEADSTAPSGWITRRLYP
jgi:pyridoxamine 5'-phosphate oxidase